MFEVTENFVRKLLCNSPEEQGLATTILSVQIEARPATKLCKKEVKCVKITFFENHFNVIFVVPHDCMQQL